MVKHLLWSVLLLAGSAFPQDATSAGSITGQVVDSSGALLAGAMVEAIDAGRGTSRAARTDERGQYHFIVLPPGFYRLRFEAEGFLTKYIEDVEVHVGSTTTVQTDMELGTVNTEVSVTATPPVVETQRTQQSTTIENVRIDQLPINRRSYLDLALLAPGIVETTALVDDNDFRVAQTPQSGLSFGGNNGRGNSFSIDGAEHYSNSGGIRPSVSQATVQEFQINQNSFSAELGGALGGATNIVTKAGSNDVRGEFFGFLRHRSIQARNYFDPRKSGYTRLQYGATVGTPVKKDRTFVFAAFERLDRQETAFVPILRDRSVFYELTPSQEQLVSFFETINSPTLQEVAAQLRGSLVPVSNPSALKLFEESSGAFPFSGTSTQTSVRLDHRFGDYHNLFIRGSFAEDRAENTEFGALTAQSRGRTADLSDATLVVNDTFVFNPKWVLETGVMFSYGTIEVTPTDPIGPELNIEGFGFFNRDIFLPSRTIERHWQLRQNVSHVAGRHDVKFGYDFNPVIDSVISETFFGGRFGFGEAIPLSAVINAASGDPQASDRLTLLLGLFGRPRLADSLSEPISALQAFSLGLPTFYQQGFGDPGWTGWSKRLSVFAQDAVRLGHGLVVDLGARYELEVNHREVGTDWNNIAPRFGFAWTPSSSGQTVIRGGLGIFYSRVNIQIPNVIDTLDGNQIRQVFVPLTGIPGVENPMTGKPLTSADIYGTLTEQGVIGQRAITSSDLDQFGIELGPGLPLQVLFSADKDYVNPSAYQASFEIQHALGDTSAAVGYSFTRGLHLPKSLDKNIYLADRNDDGAPVYGFRNPLVFQHNVYESTANSYYHSLTLRASRRLRNHIGVDAHYTWSKAIDEVTDFNSDFQPNDQLNARAEKALSAFHRAHRVVGSAVLESGIERSSGVLGKLLADWTLSPITVYSSHRPFNVLVGFDNVGDRHPNTHRPWGAGRNIGKGPDSFSVDLRLARAFRPSDDGTFSVELISEVFNVLNRTNFRSLNNVVGDVSVDDLPSPLVGQRISPTEPFGFASAANPRQFQFGVRIRY